MVAKTIVRPIILQEALPGLFYAPFYAALARCLLGRGHGVRMIRRGTTSFCA